MAKVIWRSKAIKVIHLASDRLKYVDTDTVPKNVANAPEHFPAVTI